MTVLQSLPHLDALRIKLLGEHGEALPWNQPSVDMVTSAVPQLPAKRGKCTRPRSTFMLNWHLILQATPVKGFSSFGLDRRRDSTSSDIS